jgi:hypothetical protein
MGDSGLFTHSLYGLLHIFLTPTKHMMQVFSFYNLYCLNVRYFIFIFFIPIVVRKVFDNTELTPLHSKQTDDVIHTD